MKLRLLAATIGLLFCQTLSAANFNIIGEVLAKNEISIEELGLESGISGSTIQENQTIPVAKFSVSNNDPDGFYVNISSENKGYLVSNTNKLDTITYTISTQPDLTHLSGRLGTTEPHHLNQFSLSNDAQLIFNSAVTQATLDKRYILSLSSPEPIINPSSYYRDHLTITIHNL